MILAFLFIDQFSPANLRPGREGQQSKQQGQTKVWVAEAPAGGGPTGGPIAPPYIAPLCCSYVATYFLILN